MTFGTADHVLVALTLLVDPLVAIWAYRRLTASLAAGDLRARIRSYRWTIGLQFTGAALVLVLWMVLRRPLERLVSVAWLPEGWWTVVAWGVVLLACAALIGQVVAIRGNETGLSTLRKQMSSVEGILPHTAVELKLFFALSLAAGVGEEIVFRGYLMAYFDSLVGPAGAVLASSLIFGLGHAYQGVAGIVKTGVAGLLFAGVYVATGSLLAPMLLHAVTDAVSGIAAYLALRPVPATGTLSG
jgi:membrane protease YdiL (CAAX protease family)